MTEINESAKKSDAFMSYMQKHHLISMNAQAPYPQWSKIKRDFKNAFTTTGASNCLLHLCKCGVLDESEEMTNIRKLIGYMYAKDVFTNNDMNIGDAMRLMNRNDTKFNTILNSSRARLIVLIKNHVSLMSAKNIKITPMRLFDHLIHWDNQNHNNKKDWVRNTWLSGYCYTNSNK